MGHFASHSYRKIIVRVAAFVCVVCAVSSVPAFAQITQTVEVASSPNPVGSGARALGMGGAFIGVADDATAASWNPGGLIQLERPEISIVGAYNQRTEDTTYLAFPEASGPQRIETTELNYLSGAFPFYLFGKNMIASLNYQHLYDFNKDAAFQFSAGPPLSRVDDVKYDQKGALRAISPAYAIEIMDQLSFGVALNFWEDVIYDNEWKSTFRSVGSGNLGGFDFTSQVAIDEKYRMDGFNFHLGLLWDMNQMFTLGAVFKSPFTANLEHDFRFESTVMFPSAPASNMNDIIEFSENEKLDFPMSYGIGLAARISDALTFDLDIYRTEWADFVLHTAAGESRSPITGKLESESDIDATTQIRLGGEYLFIGEKTIIPIRAGIFYDPEPSEGSPDDFYGFSIGTGFLYKRMVFDIAYQYRFGRDVRTVTIGDQDSIQDVDQHTVFMSLIYHF